MKMKLAAECKVEHLGRRDQGRRMKSCLAMTAALAALSFAGPSSAASSDWHDAEGASLRLVTSSRPTADGRLRGALEIRLKPGWKTYWIDPGDAGVPPTMDLADGGTLELAFPAPKRFDDGYSVWAGYDRPIALALTLDPGRRGEIDARAFLGLCETICIPVQASFSVELAVSPRPQDEAIVADAFSALPGPARPGFEATLAKADADRLSVEIHLPEGAEIVDLFVAGEGALALDTPERAGPAGFSVPILRGGDRLPPSLAYTLVTSAGAVSGALDLGPAQ